MCICRFYGLCSLACCESNQLGHPTRNQTQNNGGGERQKKLASKQGEAQVTGQTAEAEFFEPWGKGADQQQREEDDDEPADHGDKPVELIMAQSVWVRSPCAKPMASHGSPL